MSEDMKDLTRGEEDISHQVQGHKANLSNPSMFYALLSFHIILDRCTNTSPAVQSHISLPSRLHLPSLFT